MADGMSYISGLIESGCTQKDAVVETFKKFKAVINNGNNYDPNWPKEAEKRGLFNAPQSVDAYKHFDSPKNIELFKKMKIFTEHELKARKNILIEQFVNQIVLEANTLLKMINTGVVPSVLKSLNDKLDDKALDEYINQRKILLSQTVSNTQKLQQIMEKLPSDLSEQAHYCQHTIRPQLRAIREKCDELEKICDSHLWPYPSYLELLYDHHHQGEDEVELNKSGEHYL